VRKAGRIKIYDRKCPGLYVSITTAGVATFSFKFTDLETGKQRTGCLGVYKRGSALGLSVGCEGPERLRAGP
jgi:hypothetical protein